MVAAPQGRARRRAPRGRPLPRLVGDGSARARARGARPDRRRRRPCAASGRAPLHAAICRTCATSRSARAAITAARSARSRSCAASTARSRSTRSCARRSCSRRRARARSTSWRRTSRTTDAIVRDGNALPELLAALRRARRRSRGSGMLYLYSAGHHAEAARADGDASRASLPYLDMPIQHASDAVLARMRRPERAAHDSRARRAAARRRARRRDPHDVHRRLPRRDRRGLRAAAAHSSRRSQFERVGAFTYSPQEGTRAARAARTTCPSR